MNNKSLSIVIAIVIIIGSGSFYGGTVFEKSSLAKQNLLRGENGRGVDGQHRGPGQGGGQGIGFNRGGGPDENSGGFVAGELILKDDKSITVKMRDGGSKIVYFSDSTTIGKAVDGASSDLAIGQQVMVNGKSSPDGSLSAQNIQIRPTLP